MDHYKSKNTKSENKLRKADSSESYFLVSIGSCQKNEVSCYVLSRVFSVFKDYIVIDAGFTAISKDSPQEIDIIFFYLIKKD